ncbi:MAG: hypothetical protein KC486_07590 [Myxococcales bacterium]|nr:hypothetical protein [Myxococcales bacterium]
MSPRRVARSLAAVSLVALSLAACVGGEAVERADEDPLCVLPAAPSGLFQYGDYAEGPPTVSYAADAPLHVAVDHGCIGCKRDLEHACEIALVGEALEITASIAYEVPGGACEASCELVTSTCATAGPIAAGTYAVRYAGAEIGTLTLPGDAPALCAAP